MDRCTVWSCTDCSPDAENMAPPVVLSQSKHTSLLLHQQSCRIIACHGSEIPSTSIVYRGGAGERGSGGEGEWGGARVRVKWEGQGGGMKGEREGEE